VGLCEEKGRTIPVAAVAGCGSHTLARPLMCDGSKKAAALKGPRPDKHHLHKPQYQIDEHYDDDHSYSDNDEVSRHLHLLPSLSSEASLRPMPRIAPRPEPSDS
jgi:hypothetical protein